MHETIVHVTGVGSSASSLVIAAVAGVVGAILGAGASGFASFKLEKRREKARARAGARLIRSDLETVAMLFGAAETRRQWPLTIDLPTEGWRQFRDVVASELQPTAWDDVEAAIAVIATQQAIQEFSRRPDPQGRPPQSLLQELDDKNVARMHMGRRQMGQAYNALAKLAEGATVGQDFGSPPKGYE